MDTYLGVPNAVESKNEESLRWIDLILLQVLNYTIWTQRFFPFPGSDVKSEEGFERRLLRRSTKVIIVE